MMLRKITIGRNLDLIMSSVRRNCDNSVLSQMGWLARHHEAEAEDAEHAKGTVVLEY
jgi:hypothetical protein